MKVVVFSGPSNNSYETAFRNFEFRPPAAFNDLKVSNLKSFDVIVLADAHFMTRPAPTHYEIIELLNAGKVVIGVSSIGALRAAELCELGMNGYGCVFKHVYDGWITDDSELGVLMHPNNYKPLTLSLANARYLIENFSTDQSKGHKKEMFQMAKEVYFMDRSYELMKKKWSIDLKLQNALIKSRSDISYDIKKLDLFDLLVNLSAKSPIEYKKKTKLFYE